MESIYCGVYIHALVYRHGLNRTMNAYSYPTPCPSSGWSHGTTSLAS